MTIAATTTSVQYVRNGTTTQWSFPNKIFSAADLVVTDLDTSTPPVQTILQLNTDYTVQNVDVDTGCSITTMVAGVSGHTIDIRTAIAEIQSTSIKNQGAFYPELHEEAFDKLTRQIQDLRRLAYTFALHGPDIETVPWPSLPVAASRRGYALMFDPVTGLPTLGTPNTQTITTALLAPFLNLGIQPQESAAGVTPTNFAYPFGDLRRYGGDPTGAADSSTAFQSAASCGLILIAQGCTFKIITGATRTGPITMLGQGPTSVLQCDGLILTVTSGTGSVVDNFTMNNIAVPYVLTRNPNSWATPITTLTQSNTVLGYQPTVNDPEYTNLLVTYPSIATQNVGSQLFFQGNATNIEVSRIYGRFVSILMYDTQYSSVRDCDIRGGKASAGIEFWNINNQAGEGNKANGNRVIYSSNSGIMMARNFDFEMNDNTCLFNGESGVQTYQDLAAGVDARCYKGLVCDNICNYNYYDGVDCLGSFGTSTLEARYMKVSGNYCFQNGGDGMNIDGAFNEVTDNWIGFSQRYGIWGSGPAGLAFSSVRNNHMYDNNQARNSGVADISITGAAGYATAYSNGAGYLPGALVSSAGVVYRALQTTSGNAPPNGSFWAVDSVGHNHIEGNWVYAGPLQNNFGIYAPDNNYVADNVAVNGATFFWGNVQAIGGVVQDVVDGNTGMLTDQYVSIQILNTSGVMQHNMSSDLGQFAQNLISSRIIGAVNVSENTPTGADATTAFAFGAKIGSANTNYLILNTQQQNASYFDVQGAITLNSSGTALRMAVDLRSINVNGVTLIRPVLNFTVEGTGAAFALTTGNIAAGKAIVVTLKGKLA